MSYQGSFACQENSLILFVFHGPSSVLGPICCYFQNLLILHFCFYYYYYCCYYYEIDTSPHFFLLICILFLLLLTCIAHFATNAFLKKGKNLSPSSSALLLVLWHAPLLCQPLRSHGCVLQPLLSAHGLHHFFSLTWLSSSFSFSKTLHYVFPHHLWSLTHFILLFWTYWVELKWVRIWVLREI